MKHLSSKIVAIIVACSATMLLNVNVHAAVNHVHQSLNQRSQSVQPQLLNRSNQLLRVTIPRQSANHHYTYQNLRTVKDNQNAVMQLGAHRGRRTRRISRNVRKPHRKTSVKRTRRQNRKVRRHTSHKVNRRNRRNTKRTRNRNKQNRRNLKKAKNDKKGKNTKNKKQSRKPKAPKVAKFYERVINQRKSAVNHFKKDIRYVHNQQPGNFKSSESYTDNDYARTGTPINGTDENNNPVTFNRLTFIPKKLNNNQFYSPQGLVVAGHYAYVITNATNSYESSHNNDTDSNKQAPASYINGDQSTGTSPYKIGASQIIRIDLRGKVKDYNEDLKAARRNIKVGKIFYGGHGQGFAYNPRAKQLWLLNNKAGQVTKTAVSLINPKTLLPKLRINFHFGDTTIGDDLAFAKNGEAINVTEAGDDSFATPGAIKFFTGSVTPRGVHMRLVKQALQWAPSNVIQGLTYNARNNRIYILGDDSITSVPVNRLGHLQKADVWNTQFSTNREFEGLAFDKDGNGYLLVSRSPEILKSNYDGSLHF